MLVGWNDFQFCELVVNSFWCDRHTDNIILSDSTMTVFYCQFQSCFANAIENSANLPGKLLSMSRCNLNIIYVLSTRDSLDNWIKVVALEARKKAFAGHEQVFFRQLFGWSSWRLSLSWTFGPPSSNSGMLGTNRADRKWLLCIVLRLTKCPMGDSG